MNEGDVLVHADYDLILSRQPHALFCLGQNAPRGVAAFHMPCLTDRAWTKREVADALNASDAMLDTTQIYAGLLVLRRTPFAEAFLEQWLALSLRADLATDALQPDVAQHARFVAHRHDQSLLSLLTKARGVKTYPLPTASHDVRDVWGWDAGYCDPAFEWPLPNYRPMVRTKAYPRGVYITHYKEMGHQRDTMEDCLAKEPQSRYVPLPDYVDARAVHDEMRAVAVLEAAVAAARKPSRGGKGTGGLRARHNTLDGEETAASGGLTAEQLRMLTPAALAVAAQQPAAALVLQERGKMESGTPDCTPNVTFGGLAFEGRPYLWTARACKGVFRCAGSVLRCGIFIYPEHKKLLAAQGRGRDWLRMCSCDRTEDKEAGRHWRDGRDHAANAARSVTLEYSLAA